MYAVPVIDLLLLHSKLNPFACSLKIDLGPLNIFSLLMGMVSFVGIAGGRGLLPCSEVFAPQAPEHGHFLRMFSPASGQAA